MNIQWIFILLLTGTAFIFVIQNAAPVEIRFLIWSFEISRALLYFLLLVSGMMIGWLLSGLGRLKSRQPKHRP